MSINTKRKLETISVYTALAVTFFCLIAVQTLIIRAPLKDTYGSQARQIPIQTTAVQQTDPARED